MSGLEDDLAALENEAPEVLQAIETLSQDVFNNIQSYALKNGSHIDTRILTTLTRTQRHRILANFDGRYFERIATHVQHKVVWERDTDKLSLIIQEAAHEHICIPRPK